MTTKTTTGLQKTIETLIKAGTSFDLEKLNKLYHNDLQVIMIDTEKQKMLATKTEFIQLFEAKKANNEQDLNTWAAIHHVHVKENTGLVILDRKVNLTGTESLINLNIDFVWEDNRWQVTREVILTL
ncbi:hypothetical protein [uncultured Kordia sp.]|uniref:nuclear transport factor 2 family protein n=1 Tax=uncultured Kordia sp. TaxID=507699 RepID=UPI002634EBD4|nr:hypothetical protein [uncultured Kordia sp.]